MAANRHVRTTYRTVFFQFIRLLPFYQSARRKASGEGEKCGKPAARSDFPPRERRIESDRGGPFAAA